jgi:hypothetical protein
LLQLVAALPLLVEQRETVLVQLSSLVAQALRHQVVAAAGRRDRMELVSLVLVRMVVLVIMVSVVLVA